MRSVFESNSRDDGYDLFFFKGIEFSTLLCAYSKALMAGSVKAYAFDGNGTDFACFSMVRDARSNDAPVLSFEKTLDSRGEVSFKLYSRRTGQLRSYEGGFVKLSGKMDDELKAMKRSADAKVIRPKFG